MPKDSPKICDPIVLNDATSESIPPGFAEFPEQTTLSLSRSRHDLSMPEDSPTCGPANDAASDSIQPGFAQYVDHHTSILNRSCHDLAMPKDSPKTCGHGDSHDAASQSSIQPGSAGYLEKNTVILYRSRYDLAMLDDAYATEDTFFEDQIAVQAMLLAGDTDFEEDEDDYEQTPVDDDTVVGIQDRRMNGQKDIGDVLHEIRNMLGSLRPNSTNATGAEEGVIPEPPKKKKRTWRRGKGKKKVKLLNGEQQATNGVGPQDDDDVILYPKIGSSST
ncbi:hypothetical protein BDN72DRAFT_297590 [Pluteus cervinus]|uniref:Uncharacterized protein n=1 Tax=Pluteus cervinus TaxID=181527 RepID=A0ACD3B4F7_9AGAR|nr:hypothetical protein BDN72DRAFT_297590 [Pluteus cervinus]